MSTLYEKDFTAWSHEQAIYLRNKDFENLDIEHLIEEMGEMANSNKESIESYLGNLIMHMLKQKFQPDMFCNSWNASITHARSRIKKIIKKNPSLWKYPSEILEDCYRDALKAASEETKIPIRMFGNECPWTLNEILGE